MVTPAIVIMRDRVSYARSCVAVLAAAGLDVHVVDRASTWPEAVEWLAGCGLPVHRLPNGHPRDLWQWDGLASIVGDRRYVVTDPDVVPDCPADWPAVLASLLDRYALAVVKVGLGLRIDDLPDANPDVERVRQWEGQFWSQPVEPGVAFMAAVDTTLAMYPPLHQRPSFALGPAIRTDHPYVARHLTWYETPDTVTDEIRWYREHATPGVSHWLDPDAYTNPQPRLTQVVTHVPPS